MKITCRHDGCAAVFEGEVDHRAILRIRARRSGWGYKVLVNTKTMKMRGMDYCPAHAADAEPRNRNKHDHA